jgi:hypothetical protein
VFIALTLLLVCAQAPSVMLRVLRRGGRRMLTVDTTTPSLLATLLSRCHRPSPQPTTTPPPARPCRRSSTSGPAAAESLLELAAAAICTHIDSFASLESLPPDLSQLLFDQLIRRGELTHARLALFGGSSVASAMLSDVSSVDDAWLRRLVSTQQQSLTTLECTQCARVTDDGVAALQGCEALRNLHLAGGCVQLTDASLAALRPLTTLHTLSMQGCQAITANGMQSLAGKSSSPSADGTRSGNT